MRPDRQRDCERGGGRPARPIDAGIERLIGGTALLCVLVLLSACGPASESTQSDAAGSGKSASDTTAGAEVADARSDAAADGEAPARPAATSTPTSSDDGTVKGGNGDAKQAGSRRGNRRARREAAAAKTFDPTKMPLSHAADQLEKAQQPFEQKNYHKVVTRLEKALQVIDHHRDKADVSAIEFDVRWMMLLSRYRKNEELDLAAEFDELRSRFGDRLGYEHYRQIGVDLAFGANWDRSLAVLRDEKATDDPERRALLDDFASLIESVRTAVAQYDGPQAKIDANYRKFMERTRPDDPDELFQYAMRAVNMKVYDKALLALRDTRHRIALDDSRQDRLTPMLRFNEVLTWCALRSFDTAAASFERYVADMGDKADWITYLQVGTSMAEHGGGEHARKVLEAGKTRFADHAADFQRELDGL